MVQVSWTGRAISELDTIRRYIAQFDPAAADGLARRILRAGDGLSSFPHRGRDAGNGCRELTTVRPYILRYEVVEAGVIILRVRHSAQLPADD